MCVVKVSLHCRSCFGTQIVPVVTPARDIPVHSSILPGRASEIAANTASRRECCVCVYVRAGAISDSGVRQRR